MNNFPYNDVREFLDDHAFSEADVQAAQNGQAVYLKGETLAKIELICAEMGHFEVIFYQVADADDPLGVIQDICIPYQRVTSASCIVEPREVLRCARRLDQTGRHILWLGHGHGLHPVFTSATDQAQLEAQAREGIGLVSWSRERLPGKVSKKVHREDTVDYEIEFDGDKKRGVIVSLPDGVAFEDVRIELEEARRRFVTFFSTSNDRAHLVAGVRSVACGRCGEVKYSEIPPEEVEVCIIGPVEISEEVRAAILDELDKKVTTARFSPITEVADYQLWRKGKQVATIPAAVLEEAASCCDRLADALGWKEKEQHANSN